MDVSFGHWIWTIGYGYCILWPLDMAQLMTVTEMEFTIYIANYIYLLSIQLNNLFNFIQHIRGVLFVACLKDQVSNTLATAFDMLQLFLMPNNVNKRTSYIFRGFFYQRISKQSSASHCLLLNKCNTIMKLDSNKTQMD